MKNLISARLFCSTSFVGENGNCLAPGDYDGDGKTDIAVWRPSNGFWYVSGSADNNSTSVQWGATGDVPVPAAYVP